MAKLQALGARPRGDWQASIVFFLALGLSAVIVSRQSLLCSAETFASGNLAGIVLAIGILLVSCSLGVAAKAHFGWKPARRPFAHSVRSLALLGAATGLCFCFEGWTNYYCVDAAGLIAHRGIFSEPSIYGWVEIRRISTGCLRGRSLSVQFAIEMNDGQRIDLGRQALSPDETSYKSELNRQLSKVDFAFDDAGTYGCLPDHRELQRVLSRRPGERTQNG